MTGNEQPVAPDAPTFEVVVNHEQQYAIWPAQKKLPLKWTKVGIAGTRETCLAYVGQVWTDMRPLRVREQAGNGRSAGDTEQM